MPSVTISTGYDGDVTNDGSTIDVTDSTSVIIDPNTTSTSRLRAFFRFSLATLPAGSTVTAIDFKPNVVNTGSPTDGLDVMPYNADGQANPEDDVGTPATVYTRCANGSSYATMTGTEITVTGVKTISLGSASYVDLMNAKDDVNIFSLGVSAVTENQASDTVGFESLEAAGTDEAKLVITYTRTINVQQAHLIPYRPSPKHDKLPELGQALAGALPTILSGTWKGERIVWQQVWTLDSAQIDHMLIGRTPSANSTGQRTLYCFTADGVYYMPIGADAHPARAPWPLTHGGTNAIEPHAVDFGTLASVEKLVIQGEHLQKDDHLWFWYRWDQEGQWRQVDTGAAFPAIFKLEGKGHILYSIVGIEDASRDAAAPYITMIDIAEGGWTSYDPLEGRHGEDFHSPPRL